MRDAAKTKTELIKELQTLRQRVAQLERKVSSGKKSTRPDNRGLKANGFKAIFNDSLDIMMFIDGENGNIFDVNPAIERILGYEPGNLADRHFSTLFPPDPNLPRDEFIKQIRTDGIVIASQEFQKSDGSICPMDLTATIIPWEGQDTILATLRDVTERDETEKALRASEERFRQVISSIRDHIYVTEMSTDGRQISRYISPNIAELTGYSPEVFEKDWQFWSTQIIHPDDREIARKHLKQLAAGRQSETEYRLIKQNGETIWVRDRARVEQEQDTTVIYGIVSDITNQKQLEEQFWQSQKMEAIGQLAGGVAHDFNNILIVISGYSELILRRYAKKGSPIFGYVEEINKASGRASSLTRQLLAFSRRQVFQPQILNLNDIVARMEKLLLRIIGEDIELKTRKGPNLNSVRTDPAQIEQVILNLAVNARDAMPFGGQLLIETSNVQLTENDVQPASDIAPGSYVKISLTDTGVGIEDDVLIHIFEPFFTTKESGHGTGLGLATVHGIVKQSGGTIEVESVPGHGTTFAVLLPSVDEVALGEPDKTLPGMKGGTETILLVEDDESVSKLTRRILESYGYTVITARNGVEALQIGRQDSIHFEMLITDIVMPGGINGRELAETLLDHRPGLKVLYISGYTDDIIDQYEIPNLDISFLQKPFDEAALVQLVRNILDR